MLLQSTRTSCGTNQSPRVCPLVERGTRAARDASVGSVKAGSGSGGGGGEARLGG